MINNLNIVGRQYDYGYDIYYMSRRDESMDFPSDSAIATSLNPFASDYTVKSMQMPVSMNIKGTLKSYTYTDSGWLSKVAKHFTSKEIIEGVQIETSNAYEYEFSNYPLITGSLNGTIFGDNGEIQTFTVDLGSTNIIVSDKVDNPSIKVLSGEYTNNNVDKVSKLVLQWNDTPESNLISVSYQYESPNTYSVNTQQEPIFDEYNFVNLYGLTTIDVKYIKIMSKFRCLYKKSGGNSLYTNTSSKIFYTRCKSGQSLCSSKSSAYVPATTVCNEKLF